MFFSEKIFRCRREIVEESEDIAFVASKVTKKQIRNFSAISRLFL